jgi:hypothetical protein
MQDSPIAYCAACPISGWFVRWFYRKFWRCLASRGNN